MGSSLSEYSDSGDAGEEKCETLMALVIYGSSDDLIELTQDLDEEFNYVSGRALLTIFLEDNRVLELEAHYDRNHDGVWRFIPRSDERDFLILPELGEENEGPRYDNDGCPKYSEKVIVAATVLRVYAKELR